MKILVTGGSGFIGSNLVKKWVNDGHCVKVIDNGMRGQTRRLDKFLNEIEYIEGDVRDSEIIEKSMRGIEAVAHLAYINGTQFFYTQPDLILEIALKGLINTIDSAIKNDVANYWLMSSSEVYQTPNRIPTDENVEIKIPDPLNPRYSYGGGKAISEVYALNFGRKYFDKVNIVRPHNVYGPDMGWEHVIPQFILRAIDLTKNNSNATDFTIQGNGKQTRSFCYIDDFIDGCDKAFMLGESLNIYNVGTEYEIQIQDLAIMIARNFNMKINVNYSEEMYGATNRRCPNIEKIKKLGYMPKIKIEEGLLPTIDWYKNNIHLKNSNQIK